VRIQVTRVTDSARCVRLNFFSSVYPSSYKFLSSMSCLVCFRKTQSLLLRFRKLLSNLHTYNQNLCVKRSTKPPLLPIQIAYGVMAPSHWITPCSKPPPLPPLSDLYIGLHPLPASFSCHSDRKFGVKMEGNFSEWKPLRAGVPRASSWPGHCVKCSRYFYEARNRNITIRKRHCSIHFK
jgi:hypothetical protein